MTRRTSRSASSADGGWRRELLGAVVVVLAVVTGLSFVTEGGALTDSWLGLLEWLLGWGALVMPLVLLGLGAWLIVGPDDEPRPWLRPLAAGLGLLALLGVLHLGAVMTLDGVTPRALAEARSGGGWLGFGLSAVLTPTLGAIPAVSVLLAAALVAASVAAGRSPRELGALTVRGARAAGRQLGQAGHALRRRLAEGWSSVRQAGPAGDGPAALDSERGDELPADVLAALQHPRAADGPAVSQAKRSAEWRLPMLDEVLEPEAAVEVGPDDAEATGQLIVDTLAEFGIPVEVVQINRGPTITQFGLDPGYIERGGKRKKVKVGQITSLHNDLALALAASPIRIQAPVPGRPYVGVEVPNAASSAVTLRGVLESDAFRRTAARGALPLALGRDTSGQSIAADLARMPHLLIAGATGSGKSVCINTLISSLLLTHSPETLKLLLVDPKRVELVGYRGLPHLAAPVVVEIERVVGVLQWAVREMDRRYQTFAEVGARNITVYNQLMADRGQPPLPYLVLVIDELADLMMVAPEEAERLITRLAQLARATGMHLVLATQRPSVDVVTGLIKANFPARIAFAVSSSVDSRVILDTAGAEKLLGRGDMLFQGGDAAKLKRLQGCYVSDEEIARLTRFWKTRSQSSGEAATPAAPGLELGLPEPLIQPELWDQMVDDVGGALAEERDDLWEDAVALVREHNTASTSFLQRKLRVGYSRAARLIDELEDAGLVGPAQGNQPRDVLIGPEDAVEDVAFEAALEAAFDGEEADEGDDDDDPLRPWLEA